ncbi:thioredoxin family protein [Megasphaera sp. AM44-1BH]|uniref:thioredoxin family protein n=1 Tax=Megasphaera sp. AM44-1BH TaxID=2292358 RepID=UPI001F3741E7|nr:thioredoxin family protein [Megasphaera sp. AM44-1BH]
MMKIKVLGSGCSKCEALLAVTKEAVQHLGIDAEMLDVTDFAQIARYGVMSTPALVVDEKVVSAGRVLKASQIESFLK